MERTNTGREGALSSFSLADDERGAAIYLGGTRVTENREFIDFMAFPSLELNFPRGKFEYVFPIFFARSRSAEVRERFFPFARFPWPLSSSRLVISHSSFPFPQGSPTSSSCSVRSTFLSNSSPLSLSSFISCFKLPFLVNLFSQLFRIIWRPRVLFEEEEEEEEEGD